MDYVPDDGTWQLGGQAHVLFDIRNQMTEDEYQANKRSLQMFLCGYFSSGDCNQRQGKSISPLFATPKGGKVLKVRWALPGSGKSGSLRLVVVVYCDQRRVHIAKAFYRKDNPKNEDIQNAVADYE